MQARVTLLEPSQLIPQLHNESANVRTHAIHALLCMIRGLEDTTALIDASILPPVVGMLSRREAVEAAAALIACLAEDSANHQPILASGALEQLTAALVHEPTQPVMIALHNLMLRLTEARAVVAEAGAIPVLIQLLEDSSRLALACKVLRLLSEDTLLREKLVAAGTVQTLIRLLVTCSNSDELVVVLALLESLSQDGLDGSVMAETDWVAPMMTVLSFEKPSESLLVARIIAHLTRSNGRQQREHCVALVERGAVAPMAKLLAKSCDCQQSDHAKLALVILHSLNHISQCQDLNDALADAGCAKSASECLANIRLSSQESSVSSAIREVAAQLLVSQVRASVNARSAVRAQWEEAVLPLLSGSSACECHNGLLILLELITCNEGSCFRLQVIRSGALPKIAEMLASRTMNPAPIEDNQYVYASIQLLLSVSTHEEALVRLVEAGCLPPLALILKRRNQADYLLREHEHGFADLGNAMEVSALRLLCNLSLQQENGNAIFSSGVVWEVVRLLDRKGSKNNEVVVAAIDYFVHNKAILSGIRCYCPDNQISEADPRVRQKEWLQQALEAWEHT